ncbi:MAG: KTSC domain-containing protein [Bacteroidales bacterium]|nr:KTSC domain-containing protein [Bacteroidales bacterium]
MIKYNKYINNVDHTWYDSTNVVYSKCYDSHTPTNTLKIVYKDGRTYLFKDVDTSDYILFKNAESTGKGCNVNITKKYKGVRITDTDMEALANLMDGFINGEKEADETPMSQLTYHIDYIEETGEFNLSLNGKVIYSAVEGQVSIINLLRSMNIRHSMTKVKELHNASDEKLDRIKLNNE